MEGIAYIHLVLNEESDRTDRTQKICDNSVRKLKPNQPQDHTELDRKIAADREYIQPYYPTLYL